MNQPRLSREELGSLQALFNLAVGRAVHEELEEREAKTLTMFAESDDLEYHKFTAQLGSLTFEQLRRLYLETIINQCGGSMVAAADRSGISQRTLFRWKSG